MTILDQYEAIQDKLLENVHHQLLMMVIYYITVLDILLGHLSLFMMSQYVLPHITHTHTHTHTHTLSHCMLVIIVVYVLYIESQEALRKAMPRYANIDQRPPFTYASLIRQVREKERVCVFVCVCVFVFGYEGKSITTAVAGSMIVYRISSREGGDM